MNWAGLSIAMGLATAAFMVSPWVGLAVLAAAAYVVWR